MNKDLMMKAAIKYQGKWPDGATFLQVGRDEGIRAYSGRAVNHYESEQKAALLCTREQFEEFVDSLFEGAPKGTTHYSPEDKSNHQAWWKLVGDEMLSICEAGGIHTWDSDHFDKNIQLIPRPSKKLFIGDTPEQLKKGVEPPAPYMPKVGERCELLFTEGKWREISVIFVGIEHVAFEIGGAERVEFKRPELFRPLRTEREQFIEQATRDYLDQVGSDAVNAKWFGRVFGAMYDKGYTKGDAK